MRTRTRPAATARRSARSPSSGRPDSAGDAAWHTPGDAPRATTGPSPTVGPWLNAMGSGQQAQDLIRAMVESHGSDWRSLHTPVEAADEAEAVRLAMRHNVVVTHWGVAYNDLPVPAAPTLFDTLKDVHAAIDACYTFIVEGDSVSVGRWGVEEISVPFGADGGEWGAAN